MGDVRQGEAAEASPSFAAFISYRRALMDLRWARWLQRKLESYTFPRGFELPEGFDPSLIRPKRQLARCALDELEFSVGRDLPEQIRRTLEQSSSLIVVCSPRSREADWILAEIEEFRRLGRGDRIFALLIEGEPGQSIPAPLRDATPAGADLLRRRQVLAADVRAARWWRPDSRNSALIKLVAAILGVDFDELWQRERQRLQTRRRFLALSYGSAGATLVGLGWWGYEGRREAERKALETRHRRATEAILEVSGLWKQDSHRALGILLDASRIPKDLRAFAWEYFHRLCRPCRLAWSADDRAIHALAYLPAASRLVSGADSGRVVLWDTATGEAVRSLPTHEGPVRALAASLDGRWIASGGEDGRIRIWDVERDAPGPVIEGADAITALAFGPGPLVFGGDGRGLLSGWHPGSGQLAHQISAPAPVYALSPSPAGRIIGVGEVGTLWAWTPGKAEVEAIGDDDRLHQMRALALVRGGAGTLVATGGGLSQITRPQAETDTLIRVWSLGDSLLRAGLLGTLSGHSDAIRAMAPLDAHGGYEVASVGDDGELRIWNLLERELQRVLTAERTFLLSVASSAGAEAVATGSSEGGVRVWHVGAREPRRVVSSLGLVPLRSLTFSPKLGVFATGDQLGKLRLWDSEDLREVATLAPHGPTRGALAFAPDGKSLAAGTREGGLQFWDAEERMLIRTLGGASEGSANATTFSPDGSMLAMATTRGVLLYNLVSGTHRRLDAGPEGASDVDFSPDGETLAAACANSVRLWEAATGRPRGCLAAPESASIEAVAYRPAGGELAAACSDGSIRSWHLGGKALAWAVAGHHKAARTIGYSPDSRTLASGGFDDRVILWDPEYGVVSSVFECPEGTVADLAFTPDGTTLIVVGGGELGTIDQRIHAWTSRF